MSIFDEAGEVFTTKDFKLKNPYMVNRLLSFLPETFTLATLVNLRLGRIPLWATRAIYLNCIPKRGAAPYFYYKGRKKDTEPLLTQKVATALCCSTTHAQQTIKVLKRYGHKPETYFGLKKGE